MSLSDGPKRTGCDLPRLRSPQALGCGLWRLPKHQLWFLTFFFHPDRKSSIHLRACRLSLVCCLFLHGTQAKNDFMFFNSWKQVERRTFHDSRKLHENQTSVSLSKVKLKYSHVIHLKFVYICFLATIAELSSYERERESDGTQNQKYFLSGSWRNVCQPLIKGAILSLFRFFPSIYSLYTVGLTLYHFLFYPSSWIPQ